MIEMTHPNCYLVSYDISNEKRLAKIHKTMLGFGSATHYSVFLCNLFLQGHAELIEALDRIINHNEDRIMIVNLGPADGSVENNIEFLGRHPPREERQALIV